jgi:hypothetical protein
MFILAVSTHDLQLTPDAMSERNSINASMKIGSALFNPLCHLQ